MSEINVPLCGDRHAAARYLGVPVGAFMVCVRDGTMPPAIAIAGVEVWSLAEVRAAFEALPHVDGSPQARPPRAAAAEDVAAAVAAVVAPLARAIGGSVA